VLERLVFVTSSEAKHREAQDILGRPIDRVTLDLVEPQGLDVVEVAREKARLAAILLGRPVLVEDTSLELVALGGFPGPLVRWLLAAAGPAVIARMLDPFPVRDAVARCAAVVRDGEQEWIGVGEALGEIVTDARGAGGFGWDVVFAPEWGGGRTYAEMTAEEKSSRSHRRLAFEALRERLSADSQAGG
jgi:non-canonical purine NTP pyrophosphatase (RdgB/HAM1 family)